MPDFATVLITGSLLASSAMTGVIWMVQIVTYPQFLEVGEKTFLNYHDRYMRRMSWVVAPLMITELALGIIATVYFFDSELRWLIIGSSVVIPLIWAITFFIQVPQHSALAESGWNEKSIRALIKGNWLRTSLWTLRTAALMLIALKLT